MILFYYCDSSDLILMNLYGFINKFTLHRFERFCNLNELLMKIKCLKRLKYISVNFQK